MPLCVMPKAYVPEAMVAFGFQMNGDVMLFTEIRH